MYRMLTERQIPSNYILYRVGPSAWISAQILAWYVDFLIHICPARG